MSLARRRIYVAYGSNLHPRRLEARVGAVQLLGTVALPGWSLRFDKRGGDGSAKANLHAAPATESKAHAAAFQLSLDQVSRLDAFEGCGFGYETLPITISLGNQQVRAFTYLAATQWLSGDLLPFDWYVDLIVCGAEYYGFDESYIQQIARQPARVDPDHRRATSQLLGMSLPLHSHYKR